MKKILALVLTLAMMLTMFNVGLVVSADHLTEAPDGYTAISDEAGFVAMKANGKYILMADITLDADVVAGTGSETTYTIPAGVTLDGNGYAILSGRYNPAGTATEESYSTSSDTTKSIEWASALLVLGSGAKITISNVKFGTEANPLFLSKTSNNAALFANDDAATEVEWNNVDFYLARYGWGLGSVNLGPVMATLAGTHTFNNCVRDGFTSAGYQAGGWIYTASGNITMNKCVNNGNLAGSYKAAMIHTISSTGTVTMNNCVNNISLGGTDAAASFVSGFIGQILSSGSANLTGCVNNGEMRNAAKTAGFIAYMDNVTGVVSLTNCVNAASISTSRSDYKCYAGGFMGQLYTTTTTGWNISFTNCKNLGDVEYTGTNTSSTAAGFVARVQDDAAVAGDNANGNIRFVDCVNKGDVLGKMNNGGFVGVTSGGSSNTVYKFTRCINSGTVKTNFAAGGLVGIATANTYIDGCVNTGTIDGTQDSLGERVGGMVGKLSGTGRTLNIINSVNLGTIKAPHKATDATWGYRYGSAGQFVGGIDGGATVGSLNQWKNGETGGVYLSNVYAAGEVVLYASAMTNDGSAALTEPYNYGVVGWGVDSMFTTTCANMLVLTADQSEIIGDSKYILTYAAADIITSANNNSALPVDFMVDNGEIIIASPTLAGYQISTDGNALRFVATVDSLAYAQNVGFTYSVTVNGQPRIAEKTQTTGYVFDSIHANVNGIVEEKTAESLGATYLYTIVFTGAPTTGTVVYTIKTVADYNGSTAAYTGATYTVTFTDGAFVSCVRA